MFLYFQNKISLYFSCIFSDQASLDGQIMQCAHSGGILEIEDDKESDNEEKELLRKRREVKEKSTATKITSKNFEADCEKADVTCRSVQCTIGFMQPTSSRALIALRVQLGSKDLGSLIDEGGSILVKTFGKIILPDDVLSPGERYIKIIIKCLCYHESYMVHDNFSTILIFFTV